MIINREENPNGTNHFRIFIYTMSPTYEQNMGLKGNYQLDGFPRQLDTSDVNEQLPGKTRSIFRLHILMQ